MIRLLALFLALAAGSAAAQVVAIVHARAFPISPPIVVDDATLVFAGGRIISIEAHGAVPLGAEVIDAGGRIVTPGLMNGATQLGLGEVSEASDTQDQATTTGPLGAAFDVHFALNANSTLLAGGPRRRSDAGHELSRRRRDRPILGRRCAHPPVARTGHPGAAPSRNLRRGG